MALLSGPHQNMIGIRSGKSSVVVGEDPFFSNVVFLTDFDGADAATSATDFSNSAHPITFNGDAELDTSQKKFGTASLILDGTTDNVEAADHADWSFGSGEFTVECWVRFTNTSGEHVFVCHYDNTVPDRSWLLRLTGGLLAFGWSKNGADFFSSGSAWSPTVGIWYALAVDRDSSGKIRVYVNGSIHSFKDDADSAAAFHSGAAVMRIGDQADGGRDFFGRVDEVRITKGVARYAGAYTVATEAFPHS